MKKRVGALMLSLVLVLCILPVYADDYRMGEFSADAYIFMAKQNRIDVDFAIACGDDEVGDQLLIAYVSGKSVRKIVESEIAGSDRLSYSGLRYTYNPNRLRYDRVTDIVLYDEFGIKSSADFKDDETYTVCFSESVENIVGRKLSKTLDHGISLGSSGEALDIFETYMEGIPDLYLGETDRRTVDDRDDIVSITNNPGPAAIGAIALIFAAIAILVIIIRRVEILILEKSLLKKQSEAFHSEE